MLLFLRKLKLIRMWKLMEISIPSLELLVLIEMPKLGKCLGTYGMELTSHRRVMSKGNDYQGLPPTELDLSFSELLFFPD
jgi:hypothetical protein